MAMTVSRFFTVSAFVHFDAYEERRRRKVKFLNHLLTIDDLLSLTGDRSASAIPAREGQQTALALHRCRPLLVRQRTRLSNVLADTWPNSASRQLGVAMERESWLDSVGKAKLA
jgi:hypothetical protein